MTQALRILVVIDGQTVTDIDEQVESVRMNVSNDVTDTGASNTHRTWELTGDRTLTIDWHKPAGVRP